MLGELSKRATDETLPDSLGGGNPLASLRLGSQVHIREVGEAQKEVRERGVLYLTRNHNVWQPTHMAVRDCWAKRSKPGPYAALSYKPPVAATGRAPSSFRVY